MSRMRALALVFISLAASSAGCEQPKPVLPPAPPHGGTAVVLPDGLGIVEAIRQDSTGHAGQTRLVVYFLDNERKPLATPPTAASFEPKVRGAAKLELKPTQDPDPANAAGLASPPFDNTGDIVGVLSTTVAGKPVAVSINVR